MAHLSRSLLVVTTALMACGLAEARPLHVRNSVPAAETIFDGRNTQYILHFDGLVDHGASSMEVSNGEKVVEVLVPIRDSEPDVLAASAPTLAPGRYQLHWRAKSVPDGDFSEGFIWFLVSR
jgi:methionine-rich copper-binding protein CopC